LTDAAEVESHAHVAEREERLGERLHHLVVERAALDGQRMRDERDADGVVSGTFATTSSAPAGPSISARRVVFGVKSRAARRSRP
jgi:hypothetical protein